MKNSIKTTMIATALLIVSGSAQAQDIMTRVTGFSTGRDGSVTDTSTRAGKRKLKQLEKVNELARKKMQVIARHKDDSGVQSQLTALQNLGVDRIEFTVDVDNLTTEDVTEDFEHRSLPYFLVRAKKAGKVYRSSIFLMSHMNPINGSQSANASVDGGKGILSPESYNHPTTLLVASLKAMKKLIEETEAEAEAKKNVLPAEPEVDNDPWH